MDDQAKRLQTKGRIEAWYPKVFLVTYALVLLYVIVRAVVVWQFLDELYLRFGNDALLRLVSVRNWLGGQGWFDTIEYRMIPPEGVLMHWSRYIDAMIGGLVLFFAMFVPMTEAEFLAVAIWPTFLSVCLVIAIGFGTRRLFGPLAACFAMAPILTWSFTSGLYFRAGQIDHHNVQVLMTAIMTIAVVWPKTPVRSGIVAGLAGSVALAVGLETLAYILALGLLLFVRATFVLTSYANRLLLAFSGTLLIGATVLWLGQSPAHRLTHPVCDQLGMPVMSLIAIAAAASFIPFLVGLRQGILRLAGSVVIVVAGCVVAWSMLGACLVGPYGSLPQEVQDIIRNSIIEAFPAYQFAQKSVLIWLKMSVPVAVALLAAVAIWTGMPKTTDEEKGQRDIVGQLLILCIVGVIAVLFQVRLLSMAAGAFPLLAGFVMATFVTAYLNTREANEASKLLIAGFFILAPSGLQSIVKPFIPADIQRATALDNECRDIEAMPTLNVIAPTVVLSPLNLGPSILLTTHHSVLSGAYHRSPEAFANGVIPFKLREAEMREYLGEIGAQHLVLCKDSNYGAGLATELAAGGEVDWLEPVPLETDLLLLFEVLASEPS